MGSIGHQSHFRKLQHFKTDFSPSTITQYESSRTGMRVVIVGQEGPIIHGYFTLATEIHDDSGAPHTLEHLCFMGSRSYEYKGFLDKLATRAYSHTNAWTATDHTAYVLDTAGWAGFKQLLPVYLEHVLLPTLTDAGCLTEVHHIDGTGNDAGVVYAEMQGVQNTPGELVELRAKRILYPEGVGFRYETGGMLEPLRVLTAERIREFHREMYQPKNLCLVLTGEVKHEELLETLDTFETSVLDHIPSPTSPFTRPWIESKQTPPLAKSTIETVEFPDEDESFGQVDIRFLGPHAADVLESEALDVVLLYLAGSPAALLDNTIVEKEQLASGVSYNTDSRPRTEIAFSLSGVETGKLEQVEKRFFAVLKDAMDKELNMDFMKNCLDKNLRTVKFMAENSPVSLAEFVITDYLFGDRNGSTLQTLQNVHHYYDELSSWTESKWKQFIKEYISDANHVSILGVPSAELSKRLKKEEVERIEKQKEHLGPDGLQKKLAELEAAKAENDREIPNDLLANFEVPSTNSIHFVKTASARLGSALKAGRPDNVYQKLVEQDGKDIPLFLNFQHIESSFVRIDMIISTSSMPLELIPLVSLYLEAFFGLPLKRGDKVIDFEQVVIELEDDTVGYSATSSQSIGNTEGLRFTFSAEVGKYAIAIKWLKELLFDTIMDVERLKAITSRLLADIPDHKRSGNSMMSACHDIIHFAPKCIDRAKSTLVRAVYLKRIKHMLKTSPEEVVSMLERFRGELLKFENMRVLVIADIEKLQHPVSTWKSFIGGLDTSKQLTPLCGRLERLSEAGQHLGNTTVVVPIDAIDSSFATAVAGGLVGFDDPRLPAFKVAMSYMNSVEGPLWVAVRGTGLAYGTSISYDLKAGFVYLDVYRSPDAYKAIEASGKVIKAHIDGEVDFDPLMLEGAISGIVMGFAEDQQTLASAARATFINTMMKGLPEDYMEKMLESVRAVTVDDVKQALKELIYPIFQPGSADVIITCAPGLKDSIKDGLVSVGFAAEIRDLKSFHDDYGLKVEGEADDDQDDDSEGEDGARDEDDDDDDSEDDDEN